MKKLFVLCEFFSFLFIHFFFAEQAWWSCFAVCSSWSSFLSASHPDQWTQSLSLCGLRPSPPLRLPFAAFLLIVTWETQCEFLTPNTAGDFDDAVHIYSDLAHKSSSKHNSQYKICNVDGVRASEAHRWLCSLTLWGAGSCIIWFNANTVFCHCFEQCCLSAAIRVLRESCTTTCFFLSVDLHEQHLCFQIWLPSVAHSLFPLPAMMDFVFIHNLDSYAESPASVRCQHQLVVANKSAASLRHAADEGNIQKVNFKRPDAICFIFS